MGRVARWSADDVTLTLDSKGSSYGFPPLISVHLVTRTICFWTDLGYVKFLEKSTCQPCVQQERILAGASPFIGRGIEIQSGQKWWRAGDPTIVGKGSFL